MATYSAKDIKNLDQITHVRKRIGMYLGGNSSDGVTTGLRELVDNSIDEVLGGHGDTVLVRFFDDHSAEVQDFGRGLPVDKNADGINGIILTVGTIGSGGKFSGKTISGGLNGVGASAMNAAAARFDVTVYRDGKMHQLSFKEGRPGFFDKANDPAAKFTPNTEIKVSKDLRSAADRKKHPTGTVIRFWADFTVFLPESRFDVEDIKGRLKATSFLLPQLTAVVEDYRNSKTPVLDTYHFDAGLVDMLPTLTSQEFAVKPISIHTSASFAEVTNVLQDSGEMKQQEVQRPVDIDVAFGYTAAEDVILKSFVNIIQTKHGGTHESGLWRALSRVLINQIKATRGLLKAKDEPPILEDVKDGFLGVISIKFPEPTFSGQAKEELKTQQITSVVSQTVGNELKEWLDNKKNATQAKALLLRIVEASRIRLAAKAQKETARKKTALETAASLPDKLVECGEPASEFSELLIVEGDSALGTMRSARDARYQALLPIRGKILNVQKATGAAMLANQECANIIQVLGAGSGRTFSVEDARYSRVIIAADADVDGNHIRSLLITFFWKYMRDFVTQGRLYSLIPPLFAVTTLGKNTETFYAIDDKELAQITKKLDARKVRYDIGRNKGLGEMDADPTWDTLLDPAGRRLKQITANDLDAANDMLELAMGDKVPPRKEWIAVNREKADVDQ